MNEIVLLTGRQSPLRQALLRSFLDKNRHIAMTREEDEGDQEFEAPMVLDHNRGSFLSTRTLFLECKNRKLKIKHILILHSISNQPDVLQGFQGNAIEQKIDEDMKGFVFFLRESIACLEGSRGASINIILHNDGPNIPGPMEALLSGGIESLATSLFTYYNRENYSLRGYRSNEHDCAGYAEYIIKSIDAGQASGKWHRYRGKNKLLSFGRN